MLEVSLVGVTSLTWASTAIRQSHGNHEKSDSVDGILGDKDLSLIKRVGLDMKHESTLEFIQMCWDIKIPRFVLQELVRHRMGSYCFQSSRYTLKELVNLNLNSEDIWRFAYKTEDPIINRNTQRCLTAVQECLKYNSNDQCKRAIPETLFARGSVLYNARSFRNFLYLRNNKTALKEIRLLAQMMYTVLPEDYKFLFSDIMYKKDVDG